MEQSVFKYEGILLRRKYNLMHLAYLISVELLIIIIKIMHYYKLFFFFFAFLLQKKI